MGWLSSDFEFNKREPDIDFFQSLCELMKDMWHPPFACAGFHECEICIPDMVTSSTFEDHRFGSRSIDNLYVPYDGAIYVAPEMIAHYIAIHHYYPPDIFLQAVRQCPPQKSMDYKRLLLECGGRALLRFGE